MTLKKIGRRKLKEGIRIAFQRDDAIFDFYDPTANVKDLEGIVQDVYGKIKRQQKTDKLEYFGIFEGEDFIGYSVTGENFLYSFGINVAWRQKEILLQWWEAIKILMNKDFAILLYNRNKRAIEFLLKNNCELEKEENGITYLISYECQHLSAEQSDLLKQ